MNAAALIHHFVYEFKGTLRDKSLFFMCYGFPIGFFLIMGAIMPSVNPFFKDLMTCAMAIFTVQTIALIVLPGPFVTSREQGVFRSFKINGIPPVACVVIPLLAALPHMLLSGITVALLSALLFGGAAPANWPAFILGLFLVSLAMGSAGILIGVISSNTRVSSILGQVFYVPSIILGGLMMPASILPQKFAWLSFLTPGRHTMDGLSGIANPGTTEVGFVASLWVLAGMFLFCMGLSVYLFQWDQAVLRRGRPRILALMAMVPLVAAALMLGR